MTRPSVDVRRAGVADLDELLRLWGRARDEVSATARAVAGTAPEHLRPRLRDALAGDAVHVLIARLEDLPVGYALLRMAPVFSLSDGPCLHIEHLYVTPETRRRGVARALLSAVASVAECSGADHVMTSVGPTAREAHRFLARLGFSPFVVRRVASTGVLRRKLAGQSRRSSLDDLLSKRRSLRARASWRRAVPTVQAVPTVPTVRAGRDLPAAGPAEPIASVEPVGARFDLDALAAGDGPVVSPHDTLEMPVVTGDLADALPPVSRAGDSTTQPA